MEKELRTAIDHDFMTLTSMIPAELQDAASLIVNRLNSHYVELDLVAEEAIASAQKDDLTGLDNYSVMKIRDHAPEISQRPDHYIEKRRYNYDPSKVFGWFVGYFDLDRFKQINDEYGHPQGDRMIRYVAHIAKKVLRLDEGDELYRPYRGGDEVIVFCPIMSEEDLVLDGYGNKIGNRMEEEKQKIINGEYGNLPDDLKPSQIDLDCLNIIGWTLGERYIVGKDLNREEELKIAEENMRARKKDLKSR